MSELNKCPNCGKLDDIAPGYCCSDSCQDSLELKEDECCKNCAGGKPEFCTGAK